MAFVHLHTHSVFSLLDGANRIPELVAYVKKLGMDSLAVIAHSF
jgi:DNA polymerase-3 subunit alpha